MLRMDYIFDTPNPLLRNTGKLEILSFLMFRNRKKNFCNFLGKYKSLNLKFDTLNSY